MEVQQQNQPQQTEETDLLAEAIKNDADIQKWIDANDELIGGLNTLEEAACRLLATTPVLFRADWISAIACAAAMTLNDANDPTGERFLAQVQTATAHKLKKGRKLLEQRREHERQLRAFFEDIQAKQAAAQGVVQGPAQLLN